MHEGINDSLPLKFHKEKKEKQKRWKKGGKKIMI
jgi:hypothetical protein